MTIDTTGAEGVLFKQGAGHGGHVLFVQDGRLHYVYNFMGEDEQKLSAPDPIPLGSHVFGVRYERTGTVEGSRTPVGDVSLHVDGDTVATMSGVRAHPGSFGLAGGGIAVGRNGGQPVSSAYKAPYEFTGGTIAKVVVDISGTPLRGRGTRTCAGVLQGLMKLGRWTGVALVFVAAGVGVGVRPHQRGRSRRRIVRPGNRETAPRLSTALRRRRPGAARCRAYDSGARARRRRDLRGPRQAGDRDHGGRLRPDGAQITVALPPGWNLSQGSGDVGARLDGPDGMSATVTIAPSGLDPAAAFRDYTDQVMSQSPVSSVSILPGELCDYSGQKLMGAWSDTPQNSIQFVDRIVHVWTNTKNYLVSVHVQAPTGVDQLDAAGELLTEDFEVRLP